MASLDEDGLVGLLLTTHTELDLIALVVEEAADACFPDVEATWCAVQLRADVELKLPERRQPGDIDIMFGPWEDGAPRFDWIAGLELTSSSVA